MSQMQDPSALGRIVELVRDLRKRCSWDEAQTRDTLRPYLVEEVMELDQAIAEGAATEIKTELGDMLLHLAFQIVLGEEAGEFGAEDVVARIEQKMWRRHPHLFGGGEKTLSWEQEKLRERDDPTRSALDGLPKALPALLMAYRLQERAAGVGFDWPDAGGPREKVAEELDELDAETGIEDNQPRIESELGDLLFAVVNLARKLGIDPRSALEKANARFRGRFHSVEARARANSIDMSTATLAELDQLWDQVKAESKE